ncbi:hypothetical protein EBR77_03340 [bacterium]|nr:hypothetical protein [bacterium]NBX77974.1 hypothetical protein [bacterium]
MKIQMSILGLLLTGAVYACEVKSVKKISFDELQKRNISEIILALEIKENKFTDLQVAILQDLLRNQRDRNPFGVDIALTVLHRRFGDKK